jgi:hypothetical protein
MPDHINTSYLDYVGMQGKSIHDPGNVLDELRIVWSGRW